MTSRIGSTAFSGLALTLAADHVQSRKGTIPFRYQPG